MSAYDIEPSETIARTAGFEHTVIDLNEKEIRENMMSYVQEVTFVSDGFLSPMLAHLPYVYTREKEKVGA